MKTKGKALYPFIPSGSRFEESVEFFTLLGFEKLWENKNDGLVALRFGEAQFLLFNTDIQQWQANQIVVYEVDNLEQYYTEVIAGGVREKFPEQTIGSPQDYPWGREVQFVDLGGVFWHVREHGT